MSVVRIAISGDFMGENFGEIDRVWDRMKQTSEEIAAQGRSVSTTDARGTVCRIFHEENVTKPPLEAIDFYTSELQRFVADALYPE